MISRSSLRALVMVQRKLMRPGGEVNRLAGITRSEGLDPGPHPPGFIFGQAPSPSLMPSARRTRRGLCVNPPRYAGGLTLGSQISRFGAHNRLNTQQLVGYGAISVSPRLELALCTRKFTDLRIFKNSADLLLFYRRQDFEFA
jgi:hypothetical protein